MKKLSFDKKMLVFPIILAIVVVFVLITASILKIHKVDSTVSDSTVLPVETENRVMETYVNNEYGFSFKYNPAEFVKDTGATEPGFDMWKLESKNQEVKAPVYLIVQISTDTNLYAELSKSTVNQVNIKGGPIKKLSLIEQGEYKIITTYYKADSDFASDQNAAYQVAWLKKQKPIILLSFVTGSGNEEFLKSHKEMFDKIATSFKFF